MNPHPLVSSRHVEQLQQIWEDLKPPKFGEYVDNPAWKKLLREADPVDLGHYAFSLMFTVGLGENGGIDLSSTRDDLKIHDLILATSAEVFSTKRCEFTPQQLCAILENFEILPSHLSGNQICYEWLVVGGLKLHFQNGREVTTELIARIRQLRKNMSHVDGGFEIYLKLLDKLLGDDQVEPPVIWKSDAWMTAYCDATEKLSQEKKDLWHEVMKTAATARGSKPSKKYLTAIAAAIKNLGCREFVRVMKKLLSAIGKEGPQVQFGFMGFMDCDKTRLDKHFSDLLRALVWGTRGMTGLTGPLAKAIPHCFEPLANTGSRSSKVGTACLQSLVSMETEQAIKLLEQIDANATEKALVKALARLI